MKAVVVHDFTKSLSLEDVPKPKPGSGEVLVKVETAGLCHTDIHAAHGDWPVKPRPSLAASRNICSGVGTNVASRLLTATMPRSKSAHCDWPAA